MVQKHFKTPTHISCQRSVLQDWSELYLLARIWPLRRWPTEFVIIIRSILDRWRARPIKSSAVSSLSISQCLGPDESCRFIIVTTEHISQISLRSSAELTVFGWIKIRVRSSYVDPSTVELMTVMALGEGWQLSFLKSWKPSEKWTSSL